MESSRFTLFASMKTVLFFFFCNLWTMKSYLYGSSPELSRCWWEQGASSWEQVHESVWEKSGDSSGAQTLGPPGTESRQCLHISCHLPEVPMVASFHSHLCWKGILLDPGVDRTECLPYMVHGTCRYLKSRLSVENCFSSGTAPHQLSWGSLTRYPKTCNIPSWVWTTL